MLLGLLGFGAMCFGFCLKKYSCRIFLNILWVIFMLFSVLLFVLSGFMLIGSLSAYDTCSAYGYYTTNSAALPSLSNYSTNQFAQILNTCFFKNSTTIFTAFNDNSTAFKFLSWVNGNYTSSLPNPQFTTTVTGINNYLVNYMLNPNSVALLNQNSSNSPQAALNFANVYANFSAPGSTQTCNVTRDKLIYNPSYCGSYFIDLVPFY